MRNIWDIISWILLAVAIVSVVLAFVFIKTTIGSICNLVTCLCCLGGQLIQFFN